MTARPFREHTQRDYVRAVKNFADYLGCSPTKASAADFRPCQLHLAKQHISPATLRPPAPLLHVLGRDRPARQALGERSLHERVEIAVEHVGGRP